MSKKSKLNDDTRRVILDGYIGHEEVPDNVTHVRFHQSVVEVNNEAFYFCKSLVEVVLNEGLREIGLGAFSNCTALQSISIPSTVTKIGTGAFNCCTELKEVVLNEGLREIGKNAFRNCTALQNITIPSTVTETGQYAFSYCTSLRDVVLNEGLQNIGSHMFQCCESLQSITIPSTVTEISSNAFYHCNNLREVVLKEGIQKIKSSAFSFSSIESITFPSSVVEIGQYAFSRCRNLREVVIYNEKIQIGDKSFFNCTTSLERFKFPRLFSRLDNVIEAGQTDIEAKMDDIPAVEWRDGELVIPAIRRESSLFIMVENLVNIDTKKLDKIVRLIRYYEIKEATTLFELALWKAKIDQKLDQVDATNPSVLGTLPTSREAYRIEVPGPIKDAILQYLRD